MHAGHAFLIPSRWSRPTSHSCPRQPTPASLIRSLPRSRPTSRLRRRPHRRAKSPPKTTTTLTLSGATSSPSQSPCSPSSRTWARPAPLDLVAVIALLHPLLWNLRHKFLQSMISNQCLTIYLIRGRGRRGIIPLRLSREFCDARYVH